MTTEKLRLEEELYSVETMGFKVFSSSLDNIKLTDNIPKVLNTISPNSYGISTKDKLFEDALKSSDILVLDGVYFALSSILLQRKNIKRNQGPDVFYHFMNYCNSKSGKVFFLGSSLETLEKIRDKAKTDFPNIDVGFYPPPFKDEFSEEDNKIMVSEVNKFNPDILFVGMTCPKQEKWAYLNKNRLQTSLICSIGAVFDWYAGNYREIPEIWWKLRLGWLVRAIQRPELIRRNVPNYMIFLGDLLLTMFRIKKQ